VPLAALGPVQPREARLTTAKLGGVALAAWRLAVARKSAWSTAATSPARQVGGLGETVAGRRRQGATTVGGLNGRARAPLPGLLSMPCLHLRVIGAGCSHLWHEAASSAAAALVAAAVLVPAGAAGASGLGAEAAAPGFLDFTISFIDALGPWGPAAFVATVAIAESIPLFPTQASVHCAMCAGFVVCWLAEYIC
jgi:hypothetical protein